MEIEDIAQIFLGSRLFRPDSVEFICLLRNYIEGGVPLHDSLQAYLDESQHAPDDSLDEVYENRIISESVPQIISLINHRIQHKHLPAERRSLLKGYSMVCPFRDKQFHLYLLDVLFDLGKCFGLRAALHNATLTPSLPPPLCPLYSKRENLLDVSSLKVLNRGFLDKKRDLVVYPQLPYRVQLKLLPMFHRAQDKGLKLMVRVDRVGKYHDYRPWELLLEERIFGMPFSIEKLRGILRKEYGILQYVFSSRKQELLAKAFYIPLERLEYVVRPQRPDQLSLSIEEIIDINKSDFHQLDNFRFEWKQELYVLQRYLHALFDRNTLAVMHMDLSYMYYDRDSYMERLESRLWRKTVSSRIKTKVFRLDGTIPFHDFADLVGASLDAQNNPEVVRFLSGQ